MKEVAGGRLALAAAAVPFLVFLAVYGPAVGHGFISDDFRWIVESRVADRQDLVALFARHTGFYRPLVALSFAADYAAFGNRPLGYGLTNLSLAIACAALIYLLLRSLLLSAYASVAGSALWLLNFHGIDMAVLWTSGRTALLLVLTSVAAAAALVRGRLWLAAVLMFAALLSKEEAVTLPFTLLVWLALVDDGSATRRRNLLLWLVVSAVVLGIYAWLRTHSGAMTPATAPYFYRLTFSPHAIGANLFQYADRTLTVPAAVSFLAWMILRPSDVHVSWRRVAAGVVWIAGGYAVTIFLPVRSSLYACFPYVGACLIAAEICSAFWRAASSAAQRRATVAAIVLAIAAVPIYRARSHRWVDPADFSSSILGQLATFTRSLPDRAAVVLIDERDRRVNLESTFGTLINDACVLQTGRTLELWVEPPLRDAELAGLVRPCPTCVALTLQMKEGRIVPHAGM